MRVPILFEPNSSAGFSWIHPADKIVSFCISVLLKSSRVLQPPEANIGMPGTVTKGELEFRTRGRLTDLVWKGKVEFHVLGREEPVESVSIEKTCAWDGTKFAPLQ